MAKLEFKGETLTDPSVIKETLGSIGVYFEQWDIESSTHMVDASEPDTILKAFSSEIDLLKEKRGYVSEDVVALSKALPNLDEICSKFDKLHHHTEDEVRFTVEGSGVFEVADENNSQDLYKCTVEKGDLIVVPANRKHLFYLTREQNIQCIRLFKNNDGWEAIYS